MVGWGTGRPACHHDNNQRALQHTCATSVCLWACDQPPHNHHTTTAQPQNIHVCCTGYKGSCQDRTSSTTASPSSTLCRLQLCRRGGGMGARWATVPST